MLPVFIILVPCCQTTNLTAAMGSRCGCLFFRFWGR